MSNPGGVALNRKIQITSRTAALLAGLAGAVELLRGLLFPGAGGAGTVFLSISVLFAAAGFRWLRNEAADGRHRIWGDACGAIAALLGLGVLLWSIPAIAAAGAAATDWTFVVGGQLCLLGIAQILLDRAVARKFGVSTLLGLVSGSVALLCLLSGLYAQTGSGPPSGLTAVPLLLVLAPGCLSVALLLARPKRGALAVFTGRQNGGVIARRLIPAAILIPCLLGWLRVVGERAGLYGSEFGASLMVLMSVVAFVLLIVSSAQAVNRADAERDAALQALTRSAEQVHDLYNHAPCGYHSLDPEGRILAMNATELTWLGYRRDDVVGKLRFPDLLSPESAERFAGLFATFKETGQLTDVPLELVGRGGRVLPVILNATAVADADGQYVTSRMSVFNATELRRAEQALRELNDELEQRVLHRTAELTAANSALAAETAERNRAREAEQESEERFRLLVDGVRDYAILRLDPEGYIASWNAGARNIHGYEADEIIGKHVSCLYSDDPQTSDVARELGIAAAEGKYEDQCLRVRRDGSTFWASVVITPLRQHGELAGFATIIRDITERVAAEEKIYQLNADLEYQLSELAEANRELAQQNQENEMFVYSVSHDLRSPLVNLQGFSKELSLVSDDVRELLNGCELPAMVRTRVLNLLDEEMGESIRFIQTAVTRLSNIIDALLRLSRAGRVEYQPQHVETTAVVRRIVEAMSNTISERGTTVTISDLPSVWADPVAVEQVFANLIGNALNYLDPKRPGQVEIGVDTKAAGLAGSTTDMHVFHVRDNGLGISEAGLGKIFHAFQRLHPDVARGEGMGLAIVRRIVERHGGEIWVESSVGRGTTFYLSLPAGPIQLRRQKQRKFPLEPVERTQPNGERATDYCLGRG